MYLIRRSKDFEISIKRLRQGGAKLSIRTKIEETINILASGEKLPISYRDHKLTGELSGYRECHIKGDLLLIYKIEKMELILILVNIGSHSELFN
jgi:mRNA interferase YafQ